MSRDWGPDEVALSGRLDPVKNPDDRREMMATIPLAGGMYPTRLILETLAGPSPGNVPQTFLWTRVEVDSNE